MRYYETLYIINPNFEGERLDEVIKEVNDTITGYEGVTVNNHRIWGKKRLAYTIQNHKYGTFVLLQYEGTSGGFLKEFGMFLKLNKSVVRSQTIRLDEKPEEEIEDQKEGDEPSGAEGAETTKDASEGESEEAPEQKDDSTTEEEAGEPDSPSEVTEDKSAEKAETGEKDSETDAAEEEKTEEERK